MVPLHEGSDEESQRSDESRGLLRFALTGVDDDLVEVGVKRIVAFRGDACSEIRWVRCLLDEEAKPAR